MKHTTRRIKTGVRMALFGAAMAATVGSVNAAPTIEVTSVRQRWPWNNKLDITYRVEGGQNVANGEFYKIVFTASIDGKEYTIDGDSIGASANSDTHTVTWSGAPAGVDSDSCTMRADIFAANAPSGDDYMIVQLTGDDAGKVTLEGLLATQADSNARYNTDEYKSNKMVFRKIPAGGPYPTGDDENYGGSDSAKEWTTYRNYYIGLFAVTQIQYKNLMGSNPSYYTTDLVGNRADYRPVERISWYQIRGDGLLPTDAIVPSADGTFLQKMNKMTLDKSGIKGFDLPTTIMHEIADRAGHATVYAWGSADCTDGVTLNRVSCSGNSTYTRIGSSSTTKSNSEVGYRTANDWGLYDMAGNVFEWCLDDKYWSNVAKTVPDPFTPSNAKTEGDDKTNENRRYRGGGAAANHAIDNAWFHASKVGDALASRADFNTLGFRVAWVAD